MSTGVFLYPIFFTLIEMKLGFVTLLSNKLEGTDVLQALASQQADVEIAVEKAPGLLKVPASAKKLFYDQSADVVLVFAQLSDDDRDALALVHEKIIDVEVAFGKYVFFAVVGDDEWRDDTSLQIVAERRLDAAFKQILATLHDIAQPPTSPTGGLDALAPVESTESTAEELTNIGEEETEVKPLF